MEINLQDLITSFEDSVILKEYKVPEIFYVGAPVYLEGDSKLYIILRLETDCAILQHIGGSLEQVNVNLHKLIRAYHNEELGRFLFDYSLPVQVEDFGWAFGALDGSAVITDTFYASEVEARSKFFIYLFKNKIVDNQDFDKFLK